MKAILIIRKSEQIFNVIGQPVFTVNSGIFGLTCLPPGYKTQIERA